MFEYKAQNFAKHVSWSIHADLFLSKLFRFVCYVIRYLRIIGIHLPSFELQALEQSIFWCQWILLSIVLRIWQVDFSIIYNALSIFRGIISSKNSELTPHSSSVRAMHGVLFCEITVRIKFQLYSFGISINIKLYLTEINGGSILYGYLTRCNIIWRRSFSLLLLNSLV